MRCCSSGLRAAESSLIAMEMRHPPARRSRGRPPGPPLDVARRREELLDAAERTIRRRDGEFSLDEVAEEAGLTRSAVHAAFVNRDGLLAGLARRRADQVLGESQSAAERSQSPKDQIRAAVDAMCRWQEEEPVMAKALLPALQSEQLATEVAEQFRAVFAAGFERAGRDPSAAGPWAYASVGAVSAAMGWWAREGGMPRDVFVEHIANLLWSGLSGGDVPAAGL